MNNIVYEQLKKCRVASLPDFNKETTELIIPKVRTLSDTTILPQHYYQIEIVDQLLNSEAASTLLSQNWNGGTTPPDSTLNCYVIKIMGGMVNVEGVGDSNGKQWEGWLPLNFIKIVKEIEN